MNKNNEEFLKKVKEEKDKLKKSNALKRFTEKYDETMKGLKDR